MASYAILDSKGEVRPCGKDRYITWFGKRDFSGTRIKFKVLDDFLVETFFKGEAHTLDEPYFWHVRVTRPPSSILGGASFLGALTSQVNATLASKPNTLSDMLKAKLADSILYQREFHSKEDALKHSP
jgi:hypothetical protein